MSSVTDFETMMALDCPIKSSAATRWERKATSENNNSGTDRFIANRSGTDIDKFDSNRSTPVDLSNHAKMLMAEADNNVRVLSFKNKAPLPTEGYQNSLKVIYSAQGAKKEVVKTNRHISSAPFKILDAPDLVDDYCE
jgi:cell division cycle protein 20 (cofactor of APC complex)